MRNKMPFWSELCTQMSLPLHRRKTRLLIANNWKLKTIEIPSL
jgi:hypothetical protein